MLYYTFVFNFGKIWINLMTLTISLIYSRNLLVRRDETQLFLYDDGQAIVQYIIVYKTITHNPQAADLSICKTQYMYFW